MKSPVTCEEKPNYGNWMPKKFILIGFLLSLGLTCLSLFISKLWIRIPATLLSLYCFSNTIYAIYAYYMFSPSGGNLQEKIHNFLIEKFSWDGHGGCLEIGCGSASVAIKLAKRYPAAIIVASDYWGKSYFEYSEQQSYKNAQIEGVVGRIEFKNADAAHLPFEDESFDAVISNLTFHEVATLNAKERYKTLVEALRVLKKGGYFGFQDLFGMKFSFGNFEQLRAIIGQHVQEFYWVDSFNSLQIPHWLDNVVMLKGLGLFYGKK